MLWTERAFVFDKKLTLSILIILRFPSVFSKHAGIPILNLIQRNTESNLRVGEAYDGLESVN